MIDGHFVWVLAAFFMVALIYSMVGFGGGSSYLAILAVSGLAYSLIPPIALVCNVVVAGGGFIHFLKSGHFKLKYVLPFTVLSVPAAYLGGRSVISKEIFTLLLGLSLLFAAIRMLMPDNFFDKPRDVSSHKIWILGLPMGALLGYLSGLVGIGGGIFLSPLLLFLRWVDVKKAGACASFFIVINSLAGLSGQLAKSSLETRFLVPLVVAVFLGGQIGSRIGSFHLPKISFQRVLAVLVGSIALKMLMSLV